MMVIRNELKHVAVCRDILYEIGLCLTDAFYFVLHIYVIIVIIIIIIIIIITSPDKTSKNKYT